MAISVFRSMRFSYTISETEHRGLPLFALVSFPLKRFFFFLLLVHEIPVFWNCAYASFFFIFYSLPAFSAKGKHTIRDFR